MAAIEDGLYEPSMKDRLPPLERQKVELQARLATAPEPLPAVHPGIAESYRARIERLAEALDDPEASLQAAEAIRSLVGQVGLTPGTERGQVHAAPHGELGAILPLMAQKNKGLAPGTGVRLAVAADKHARRGAQPGMEGQTTATSAQPG